MLRFNTSIILIISCLFFSSISFSADKTFVIATTTSLENTGFLDYVNEKFTKMTGITPKVVAKGTGAAIQTARDGNADLIITHDKQREEDFVREGFGEKRIVLMHNDFVLVGPNNDPANVDKSGDIVKAFANIAKYEKTPFVSRGDDSGTHSREQAIWKQSGVKLIKVTKFLDSKDDKNKIKYEQPIGRWYLSVGQGMAKAFAIASEKRAYLLIDRGTYLALSDKYNLKILVEGDKRLLNEYSIIVVSPEKFSHVKYGYARKYADWLASTKNKGMINNYRPKGHQLFYTEADKTP